MSEITGVILPVSINDLKGLIADAVADGIHSSSSMVSLDIQEDYLDIQQAAKFLKLAVPTLYGLTCSKKIQFYKPGKKLYFKKSDLQVWRSRGKSHVVGDDKESTG